MDSLLSQSLQTFRIIIVDDNSPDNSVKIFEKYAIAFGARLVVIKNSENMGLSGARNVGLDYVSNHRTKYVTFLDPDDWIDDDYLIDLYKNAEDFCLDLCISGVIRYNEVTNKIICKEMVSMPQIVFDSPGNCNELAYINPCAYSKLYRFDPIFDLRFRNIKRSEDTCYLFEALTRYRRIKFTNNAYYHYCVRDNSLTGSIDNDKYISMHNGFSRLIQEYRGIDKLKDQLVTQIFIRSSLGGVCRISFSNMKLAKKMEKEEYLFLERSVPSWRSNRYLSFSGKGIGGKKEFYLRIVALLYKMHLFTLFIWVYWFYTKILGRDIRA